VGDGAIAGRTAYLSVPYEGTTDDYGILAIATDVLEERVMTAHKAGFQVAVHANGDRIINMTLDAYEKALRAHPREDHRHRLEHGTVVNPEILARMKRLGVAVLPFGSYIYYHGEKMRFYGEKRLSMMFAHRSFLDNGIIVGGSSDHQCAPWPPLAGIQSCVTRKSHTGELLGPEQRVTPEEALWIYTMGSAYTSFEEKIKGSVEVGKLADLVILGEDLTQVDPETIKDIPVMATMVGGAFVYES
jgi:predicted amidohydrolase YtcJ